MDNEQSIILFSDQQFEDLERLAGANYSPEEIALYFQIDKQQFIDEFNKEDSKIRYHYDRGQLIVKAQANMELYNSAKTGNVTAISQLDKARAANKLEQAKKKHSLAIERTKSEKLQSFLQTKHKGELDPELFKYYEQLDLVRSLWQKGHAKNFIINSLFSSFPELSLYRARIIFDEAINFFYLDSGIKKQAWANYYADELDKMAKICYEMGDFNQARLLIKDAAEMRELHLPEKTDADKADGENVFIYTLEPEQLGLPKANRTKLAKFIDGIQDISEVGRDRLHIEAMDGKGVGNILNIPIQDVDYLDVDKSEENAE